MDAKASLPLDAAARAAEGRCGGDPRPSCSVGSAVRLRQRQRRPRRQQLSACRARRGCGKARAGVGCAGERAHIVLGSTKPDSLTHARRPSQHAALARMFNGLLEAKTEDTPLAVAAGPLGRGAAGNAGDSTISVTARSISATCDSAVRALVNGSYEPHLPAGASYSPRTGSLRGREHRHGRAAPRAARSTRRAPRPAVLPAHDVARRARARRRRQRAAFARGLGRLQ